MAASANELSEAARAALMNIGTSRVGAPVNDKREEVRAELRDAGMTGPENGLTIKGSIARERALSADLDALF